MNNNDLMNALSGLDPKYIDEAAYELHSAPASKKNTKIVSFKKGLAIAFPIAAALILTVLVALPAISRLTGSSNMSESSTMSESSAPSHEAAYSDSYEEAAEAPEYGDYEAAEAPSAYGDYEATDSAAYEEAAEPSDYDAEATDSSAYEEAAEPILDASGSSADSATETQSAMNEAAKENDTAIDIATYENGILTIEVTKPLPADYEESEYTITGTASNGSEKEYARGTLDDVITGADPLTLDISGLNLPKGTYTITFAGRDIEFTV
ncbi:MAG: hypothetical protein K6G12_00635 [Lachnospiraceae bacterium]|nr:hypothetical protein [Lachnospiraceae bacterium]